MTNRELLDKIRELDIEVSSHMSSLDDDVVTRVKSTLFGSKDDQLEEKRIRPTVIRRRKVVVPQEPETPEVETAAAEASQDLPDEEETASTAAQPETPPQKKPVAKKRKPAESAKIIAKPKTEAPAEKEAPAPADEVPAETPAPASVEPETAALTDDKAASAEDQPSAAEAGPPTADAAEDRPEETGTAPQAPVDEKAAQPSVAKGKKGKKEAPARIIKLPTRPVKPSSAPPSRGVPAGPPEQAFPPRPDAGEESLSAKDRKKKGWRKKDADAEGLRFTKKKGGFRKKEIVEGAALYSGKMRGRKGRKGSKLKAMPAGQKTQITTAKAIKRRVKVDETIVLSELAKRMGIKANEMIVKLMGMGVMATVNQTIDYDTAVLVAGEFNYEVEKASFEEDVILKKTEQDDPEKMAPRPPVVTIMGHVDHGKTSLLDVIRKTRVTEGEAGGITQHIGAYHVQTEKGVIAFLDTPGHEAFSAMRSRGAKVTDIVVLVVAADDGVMPQTVEAINHSRASGVPIIVAVNKMDKPDADPDRVQRELSEHGLMPEAWGGDAIFVMVSAKKNTGIDELLEMILLQAEILELKANPDKLASGHVVEAKLDSGRGPVATVLVQDGTLRAGDSVVCGMHYGKIRVLQDDLGRAVESAGPSMPVEIVGLSGVPMAGDELVALADEKDAKQVSQHRTQKQRSKELAKTNRLSLEGLFEKMQQGEVKDLNLIIKADVDGSIEALRDSLVKLSNEEVSINVVHAATGTITESDISLAAVSNAIIIGFNVR
ncbi:MAG TPA: translation initiation factor IF-2, partial [Desulfosarcina sp.]|nr:translation initiation factor IF-2 [Desulfosarcina sp.]